MEPTVAVDFGTSTILVGVRRGLDDPDPTIVIGKTTTWMPSLVGIDSRGSYVFGEDCDDLPDRQRCSSIKTRLGAGEQTYDFKLEDGSVLTRDIDEMIQKLFEEALDRARENAHKNDRPYLKRLRPVHLCCPANWTSEPRRRLGEIAERAGLLTSPDEIVDEPIAAGVSWVMGHYAGSLKDPDGNTLAGEYPEGKTLVFDYGGGTLDVAVLQVKHHRGADEDEADEPEAAGPEITVLASDAHPWAGDKLDEQIFQDLEAGLRNASWSGGRSDAEKEQLIRMAARRLKHSLSDEIEVSTPIPDLGEPVRYTRTKLEKAFKPALREAIAFVFEVIGASLARVEGVSYTRIRGQERRELAGAIDHLLLAGGMSRIPLVRAELEKALRPRGDSQFDDPEKSVVDGLTFEDAVAGLNLHRPGFDFVAYYHDQNGRKLSSEPQVLYQAFEPFYTAGEPIIRDFGVGKKTVLKPPGAATTATITCRRVTGQPVPLSLGGPIELRLDHYNHDSTRQYFKLYLTGHLVIRGRQLLHYYIPRWPQVSSGLEIGFSDPPDEPDDWWGPNPEPPTKYG